MAGAAKPTTGHQKIRQWVEDHGGYPAAVKQTGSDDDPGVLRIDFPGYSGEGSLEPISWDEFFEKRTGWRSCTAEDRVRRDDSSSWFADPPPDSRAPEGPN